MKKCVNNCKLSCPEAVLRRAESNFWCQPVECSTVHMPFVCPLECKDAASCKTSISSTPFCHAGLFFFFYMWRIVCLYFLFACHLSFRASGSEKGISVHFFLGKRQVLLRKKYWLNSPVNRMIISKIFLIKKTKTKWETKKWNQSFPPVRLW